MSAQRRVLMQPATLLAILASVGVLAATGEDPSERPTPPAPLIEAADSHLYLIGDAGAPAEEEPVFRALREDVSRDPGPSVVVFLGDNIYPQGLPAPHSSDRKESERRLEAQLELVRSSGARGIFLPGNHDWATPGAPELGWDAIRRQARYVTEKGDPQLAFLPEGGCPGPVVRDFGGRLRLVILDTEWWLREGPKPTHPTSDCPADSEAEILSALTSALASAATRQVVVASHHPLATAAATAATSVGRTSSRCEPEPLALAAPLPASPAYPLARVAGISNQDFAGTLNKRMRAALEGLPHPSPLLHAAGHEHNLQVFRGASARYLAVSGSGYYRRAGPMATAPETLFARATSGYMRLDLAQDGRRPFGGPGGGP